MTGGPVRSRTRGQGPADESASVFATDEQHDQPVDTARWAELARLVLVAEDAVPHAEVSLLFVDEGTIAGMNERFMGSAPGESTDVLSFPIDGDPARSGEVPVLLGDVVICPAVAARSAPRHAGSVDDELALLVVHGLLHLLGRDHATETERAEMQARERELLDRFHGEPALDPWR